MIERFEAFFTPGMDRRLVSVCLPEEYRHTQERYPVMYVLDGQNAFEKENTPYGCGWELQRFAARWDKQMILVGIESSAECDRRMMEYCPYPLTGQIWAGLRGRGEATIQWIEQELKPVIDDTYRTLPDRENTGILGASVGALASLYAATAHNTTFSRAACVSPAFAACFEQVIGSAEKATLGPDTRLYLSCGEDEARDKHDLAQGVMRQLAVGNLLARRGANVHYALQKRGRHCEADWRGQAAEFMSFLWQ